MKKIRVTVSCELEVPAHWDVLSPFEDEPEHLLAEGKFYQPRIMWMEYKGKDEEGHETCEDADETIDELIDDHMHSMDFSVKMTKKF